MCVLGGKGRKADGDVAGPRGRAITNALTGPRDDCLTGNHRGGLITVVNDSDNDERVRIPAVAGLTGVLRQINTDLIRIVLAGPCLDRTADGPPTFAEAERLVGDLEQFTGPDGTELFPAWETLPFERVSPSVETMGRRLRLLHLMGDPGRSPSIVAIANRLRRIKFSRSVFTHSVGVSSPASDSRARRWFGDFGAGV